LRASFFNQLGVAFVAGAALQIFLTELNYPAATAVLFMAGFALHGVAHILGGLADRGEA
jgi:hypothetical protein